MKYTPEERTLFVDGELSFLNAMKVQTGIHPGFPTDLQAPMGVLMTQSKGVSRIFETIFEGRMAYLYELEKMGAHVEILNAHQALIIGQIDRSHCPASQNTGNLITPAQDRIFA